MSKFTAINIFPFTVKQLIHLEDEIKEAGSFDLLMRKKEALLCLQDTQYIVECEVEEYKSKYITGIYEPLRSHYTTRTPYTFWVRMYAQLERAKEMLC
jgi:hypothetical protein